MQDVRFQPHPPALAAEMPYPLRRAEPFIFLVLAWLIGGIGSTLPLVDNIFAKGALLATPLLISLLVTLVNPDDGFAIWTIGIGLLVTQTGYQLDVAGIRTSALELMIVALLPLLAWSRRRSLLRTSDLRVPGRWFFAAFAVYAFGMLFWGLLGGIAPNLALYEFKGFLLYPLIIFLVIAGVQSRALLRWSLALVVAWFVIVAGRGIVNFLLAGAASNWDALVRTEGDYATINTYGITLTAIALLLIGIAISLPQRGQRLGLLAVGLFLFAGALTAESRTVWIIFGFSLVFLLVFGHKHSRYPLGLLMLAGGALLLLPHAIVGRILQLSDSSTTRRSFYLDSGLAAWRARWLTGWGWGHAYWITPSGSLTPTGWIPWYHNDYLNLAVQTGVIGVALYGLFWAAIIFSSQRWLAAHRDAPLAGYVRGGLAALLSLLLSAMFEHVLWRPDIAGLLGWLAGLLLAAIALDRRERAAQEVR